MKTAMRLSIELAGVMLVALVLTYLGVAHLGMLVVAAWIIGILFGGVINTWLDRLE